MTRRFYLPLMVVLLGVLLPVSGLAQSDGAEPSLGDLARSLRKGKPAVEHPVIDNENLHQVMDEVQNRKLNGNGSLLFSFDGAAKKFQVSSPDVTCDLSFSGSATSLLSDAYAPQDLPEGELAKLDGPATISGDTLQIAVHNGTSWNIKEITVGLTILRDSEANTAARGSAGQIRAIDSGRRNHDSVIGKTSRRNRSLPPQRLGGALGYHRLPRDPGHGSQPRSGMALGDRAGKRGSSPKEQQKPAAEANKGHLNRELTTDH